MDGAVQGLDSPSPCLAAPLDAAMELPQLRTSLPPSSPSPEPGSCSSPSSGAQLGLSLPAAGWVSAARFHGSRGFPACRSWPGGERSQPAQPVSPEERVKASMPEGGSQLLCRSQALCPTVLGPRRGNPGFSPGCPQGRPRRFAEGLTLPCPRPAHLLSFCPPGESQRLGPGCQR